MHFTFHLVPLGGKHGVFRCNDLIKQSLVPSRLVGVCAFHLALITSFLLSLGAERGADSDWMVRLRCVFEVLSITLFVMSFFFVLFVLRIQLMQ